MVVEEGDGGSVRQPWGRGGLLAPGLGSFLSVYLPLLPSCLLPPEQFPVSEANPLTSPNSLPARPPAGLPAASPQASPPAPWLAWAATKTLLSSGLPDRAA